MSLRYPSQNRRSLLVPVSNYHKTYYKSGTGLLSAAPLPSVPFNGRNRPAAPPPQREAPPPPRSRSPRAPPPSPAARPRGDWRARPRKARASLPRGPPSCRPSAEAAPGPSRPVPPGPAAAAAAPQAPRRRHGQQQPRRGRRQLPGAAGGAAPGRRRRPGPAAAAERRPEAGGLRQAGQRAAAVGQREDHEPQPHDPHQHPLLAILQGAALRAQDVPRGGGRDLLQGEGLRGPQGRAGG